VLVFCPEEYHMSNSKAALALAFAAALSPAICNASSDSVAFDACVSAFEKSIAVPGTPLPLYKVMHRGVDALSPIEQYFARTYTYDLTANDPKSGAALARARCSTDGRGVVISLSPLPLDAFPSVRAARS
jgi:hypothetical protein